MQTYFQAVQAYFKVVQTYFQAVHAYFQTVHAYFQAVHTYFQVVQGYFPCRRFSMVAGAVALVDASVAVGGHASPPLRQSAAAAGGCGEITSSPI